MHILVTGAAGFIGFHLCRRFLEQGYRVFGVDNLNDYYSPLLKRDRLSILEGFPSFQFQTMDISHGGELHALFASQSFTHVVNMAAQAGVRYSLANPEAYIQANLVGFGHLLECCRHYHIEHFVYASSSSVYGMNTAVPFSEEDPVDHPVSLYAATKKSNEMMAHSYSHLFGVPCTGLRFFTVYGPWGRPDMALFLFTEAILSGKPIKVFNHGKMQRDFTYIDDIVEGVFRITFVPASPSREFLPERPSPAISSAPFRIYNIGNNTTISLEVFITELEAQLGQTAMREYLPMQDGDVVATYADIHALEAAVGFSPRTPLNDGIRQFVQWYKAYYSV